MMTDQEPGSGDVAEFCNGFAVEWTRRIRIKPRGGESGEMWMGKLRQVEKRKRGNFRCFLLSNRWHSTFAFSFSASDTPLGLALTWRFAMKEGGNESYQMCHVHRTFPTVQDGSYDYKS